MLRAFLRPVSKTATATSRQMCPNSLRTMTTKPKFSTKLPAKILEDGPNVIVQAIQDIAGSNELKLVRLVSIKILTTTRILLRKHVLEHPKCKQYLQQLRFKLEELEKEAAADVSKAIKTEKKIEKIERKEDSSGKSK